MKVKALLFAVLLCGLGACTQRTCPTYTKNDVQQQDKAVEAPASERV